MPDQESDSPATTEIWRAGDLELDVGQQCVRQSGAAVELSRLSFELLLALLRAAPNFVSNEELMARVWRGLVVSPETVTQRVKLLRDALRDDPRQPRYIEGLRGRGYRIIPSVYAGPASPPPIASLEHAPEKATPARAGTARRWRIPAAIAGMAALLASVVLWHPPGDGNAAHAPAAERTVAILRFKVLGDVAQSEAMAIGLVDSVAAQLSGVSGLQITATESAAYVDMAKLGPREAGRLLGARYLVDGSVQQSGGMLRVTARVMDAYSGDNGNVFWSRQFNRDQHDFFGIQDAVATGVVRALESRIADLDPTVPAGIRSQNVEAQLAYLRGRALLGRTTLAGSVAAELEFAHAAELDPGFAPALVGIYDARMQATSIRRTGMAAALAQNEQLLIRAAALDPDSGAVQLARAMWGSGAPEDSARLFEEGLKKDRSNARAMTAYSELLDGKLKRPEEGAKWLEQAMRIDPLWPRARFRAAQRTFDTVGAAVEQQTQKVLELDPNYYPALQRFAKYRWQHHAETAYAISIIERAIANDPGNPWGPHTAAAFYLDVNDPRTAERLAHDNPVVAASTAALRALYAGERRKAGEAALEPGSFVFNSFERWGVACALRDYALETRQFDRVIHLISGRYSLPLDQDWKISVENFREAQLTAHLLIAQGHREQGLRHLDEVIRWIDANEHMGPVYNLRTKAQALVLKGEADAALSLLAESFRQNDYTHWWYTVQRDPTWDGLRTDARFVAIAAMARSHADREAKRLAQLRSSGEVPDRLHSTPNIRP